MIYKNISSTTKTFYGVEFKPGDVKAVPGYITSPIMSRVDGVDAISTTAVRVDSTPTRSRKGRKKSVNATTEVATSDVQIDLIKNEEELKNGSDND